MPDVTAMSCAKMAEPIEMSFGLWTQLGTRKHVLHGVHIGATQRIRLNRPCAAALQNTAEPTEMPFGLWTMVGPRKHVLHGGTHLHNLANMTELSMCGGNAAFLSNCFDQLFVT